MASGGSNDMTSGGSRDMATGGSREPKKPTRKCCGLEWDVYDDHTQKTQTGWERVQQPWSAEIALQFVDFPTLIGCNQDFVTSDIVGPSMQIITSLKMWR